MPGAWSLTWKADLSRVLLIGQGPLPHRSQEHCSFPQLRTQHFKQVLERAGVEVRLLLLEDKNTEPRTEGWSGSWTLQQEGPNWLRAAQALAREATVLIAAGPYNPSRLACLIADERPVWADIPGDPLAELQALQSASIDLNQERRAAALAAILPVLCRADAISTVSQRQRLATVGQLHLLGRRDYAGMVPVHSIPIAWNFPFESQLPTGGSGLQIALVGAFNAWLDHDTLIEGLEAALRARPELRFCCIGGSIEAMPTGALETFSRWAHQSAAASRIQIHGWVPQSKLPELLSACHAGIWMDRPGDEPLLGSRTRALLYAWMGLQILGSPSTELAEEILAAGHLIEVPVGDSERLCEALMALQPEAPALARSRQHWMADRYGVDSVSSALVEWSQAPRRQAPADHPAAVLAADHARLRDELNTMRETPTWKVLAAAHRALGSGEG